MTQHRRPGHHGRPHGEPQNAGMRRREVLQVVPGAATFSILAGPAGAQAPDGRAAGPVAAAGPVPASRRTPLDRPYNIVLFISDEEAYHLRPAEGYATPAREELQRRGTTLYGRSSGMLLLAGTGAVAAADRPA